MSNRRSKTCDKMTRTDDLTYCRPTRNITESPLYLYSYTWINKQKSKRLLKEFQLNKSPSKKFVVSKYIPQEELDLIKAFTDKIYTLDSIKITGTLLNTPQKSLAHGDNRIDCLKIQNHHDIEKLIEWSVDWLKNKMLEINATNVND